MQVMHAGLGPEASEHVRGGSGESGRRQRAEKPVRGAHGQFLHAVRSPSQAVRWHRSSRTTPRIRDVQDEAFG